MKPKTDQPARRKADPTSTRVHRVNIDLPSKTVAILDREAENIGIPRQTLIKTYVHKLSEELAEKHAKQERHER